MGPPNTAEEISQGVIFHQGSIGEGRQREKKVVETPERIMDKVPWEYEHQLTFIEHSRLI